MEIQQLLTMEIVVEILASGNLGDGNLGLLEGNLGFMQRTRRAGAVLLRTIGHTIT